MNQRRMQYDAAGNLVFDNYTGAGSRGYDAESRMVWAQDNYNGTSYYTFDAGGRRVKRNIYGSETWQVYGMAGELLAEYQAGAAPVLATKEYGYRGGTLLVTMSSGDVQRMQRFVTNLYYGALQRDPTPQELQDKVNQLASAAVQGQSQLQAVAVQIARSLFTGTAYETSPYRSDQQYVSDLYYTYLQRGPDDSGLNWWSAQVPSSGRANVCNAFEASSEFQTLVSTLYGTATGDNQRTEQFVNNFYLGAYGRFATATELQTYRDDLDAAAAQGQSQVQSHAEAMGRALFASQVNDYSITDQQYVTNLYEGFLQRGPDAGGLGFWSSVAAGGPQNRQNVLNAFATCGPFRDLAGTLYRETFWLVSDHLGTPRMVVDKTGSLAGVKRHDYLPFGDELYAGAGGRATGQGYNAVDNVRQKFTGHERDNETGLDYAQARYYSPSQGRFTSVDPLITSAKQSVPQSWNRYAYCVNNPLFFTDPGGLLWYTKNGGDGHPEWFDNDPGEGYTKFTQMVYYAGEDHGYVVLDQHRNYWQDGFESEEDARGFSDRLDADERMLKDPPQDISISKSMSMPEMALIPIPGTGVKAEVEAVEEIGSFAERSLLERGLERAAVATAETAERLIPQIIKNRIAGKAAEKLVADELVAEGNTIIASQVGIRTSQGLRFIDHLIRTPEGELVAVEVKSGAAVRSASQLAKDEAMATEGAVIVSSKVPAGLKGTTQVIRTVERRVPSGKP